MGVPQRPTMQTRTSGFARSGFGMLLIAVLAAWIIEIVDQVVMDDRLQRNGIHPREVDGIDGILWAPFLHSGFGHLSSNTVPLLVMGGLIAARGRTYWARITLASLSGGALVWLLGGSGNHIGASGVVFGYFGALLGAAWFERRPAALGGALIAVFLYSGSLAGVVPQGDLSWESHLFGFIVGFVAARVLAEPRRRPDDEDEVRYDWELDEPWRD